MRVFGQRIHLTEAGNGFPLFLLHGAGADSSHWSRVAGSLSQRHRVIAPDQIGFGESDKPFLDFEVGTMVSFLDGLFRELRIERASLVGHSVSGVIAAAFALAFPDKVEHLVLVNAGFFEPLTPDRYRLLHPSTRDQTKHLLELTAANPDAALLDQVADQRFTDHIRSAWAARGLALSLENAAHAVDPSSLRCPTLVVWGRNDQFTPLALGSRLQQRIPKSQLELIEEAGHAPHLDQPARFCTAVKSFLAGEGKGGRPVRRREEENVWF